MPKKKNRATSSAALLIFVKNAELGKVKTRLAATVGDHEALRIYEKLLAYTRGVATTFLTDRFLFYSDFLEEKDAWQGDLFYKLLQTGNDLGERMQHAFEFIFAKKYHHALLIGSDCPTLTDKVLQAALEALQTHDLVIGPATDGGYYLLGMNQLHADLLQNIAWSSEDVLSLTVQKAKKLNLKVSLLAVLPDIDYEEDWKKYGWK